MNELISITTGGQGSPVVSARTLYDYLGFDASQWSRWSQKNIIRNPYAQEGEDWQLLDFKSSIKKGSGTRDYAISLDFAKRLSMLARTEKGETIRRFFIDRETQFSQLEQSHLNQRITKLERKLSLLIESHQQAARSLLELPRSSEPIPQLTTRANVQRLVNSYCRAKGLGQQEVWRLVYERLYYLYRINIRGHKRSERESWLDVADRKGYMDKIYAIVSAELTYSD